MSAPYGQRPEVTAPGRSILPELCHRTQHESAPPRRSWRPTVAVRSSNVKTRMDGSVRAASAASGSAFAHGAIAGRLVARSTSSSIAGPHLSALPERDTRSPPRDGRAHASASFANVPEITARLGESRFRTGLRSGPAPAHHQSDVQPKSRIQVSSRSIFRQKFSCQDRNLSRPPRWDSDRGWSAPSHRVRLDPV